jgi:hypothetical protein
MVTEEQAKEYVRKISMGMTCSRKIRLFRIVGDYLIVHHKGHTEYVGGWNGTAYCETEYAVFKYEDPKKFTGHEWLKGESYKLYKITGRLTKKKEQELMDKIKELQDEHR